MTRKPTAEATSSEVESVGLDLVALTQLGLDLWVACAWEHRPPQGLAGLCDWRLHGRISREIARGRMGLGAGEVTLIGASRRLAGARLALVGLGPGGASVNLPGELARAAKVVADLVHQLGSREVAVEIPVDPVDPRLADPITDPRRSAFVSPLTDDLGAGGSDPVERLVLVSPCPSVSKKNLSEPDI